MFAFQVLDLFTRRAADKIIGFNSEQGDTIAINVFVFPGLEASTTDNLRFVSADSKKELKQLSRQDYNFVYYEKKGRLYYDGNGSMKNWGNEDEGGLVAILKGKPSLTSDDFVFLV